MSTSRWLSWTPGASVIEKSPEPELTKPTKPNSVSFVSPPSGQISIIEGAKDALEVRLVPIACRCSARRYPHIHSLQDRKRAIAEWNRDSAHQIIEPIH